MTAVQDFCVTKFLEKNAHFYLSVPPVKTSNKSFLFDTSVSEIYCEYVNHTEVVRKISIHVSLFNSFESPVFLSAFERNIGSAKTKGCNSHHIDLGEVFNFIFE